jgi:hypothetical protein
MSTKFDHFATEQTGALKTLYQEHRVMPYLMLLYATVDILGFIVAEEETDPPGKRFQGFVDRYMIKHLPDVNSFDLWGARCALLHTATPQSYLSRQGRAREILYSWGAADSTINKKVIKQSKRSEQYVAITLEELHESLICGLEDLAEKLKTNKILDKQCLERVNRFYSHIAV